MQRAHSPLHRTRQQDRSGALAVQRAPTETRRFDASVEVEPPVRAVETVADTRANRAFDDAFLPAE